MSLIDDKNRSKLDAKIKETKQAIRNDHQQWLTKRKDHIMSLGNVFVTFVSNPESVCEEIKNCLQEEIADKLISARDIERYCPDKWKKKTKPKNDKLSFSKQVEKKTQQQIASTQEGLSSLSKKQEQADLAEKPQLKQEVVLHASGQEAVIKPEESPVKPQEVDNGDGADTNTLPLQPEQSANTNTNVFESSSTTVPCTSPQSIDTHATGEDSMSPGPGDKSPLCKNCLARDIKIKKLEEENRELGIRCSQAESSNTKLVLQLTSQSKYINELQQYKDKDQRSHPPPTTLQRRSIQTADQVPSTGPGFPIPKEKHGMVIHAMDRSKSAIFVEYDESKKFVRVVTDVDN
jgi:hypothetical protein